MLGYLTVFHVVVCILIVILVLLQFGKGAEVGLFASSSENMFSSSQRKNVLARATTVLMVLFIANSILLARLQETSSVTSGFANTKIGDTVNEENSENAEPDFNQKPAPQDP